MPMADGRLPQVLVTRATISTTTMQKIVDSESLQRHSCDIFASFSILMMKCVGFVLFDQRMNKS